MTGHVAEKLRNLLEDYRGRMKSGGHPKELPDKILALARDFPSERKMPEDLQPLYAAARHYWDTYGETQGSDRPPDPLDVELVCDEVIDALYEFYGLR